MFDHVGIVVADLERSARFYGRVLAPLGLQILEKHSRGPNDGWVVISSGAARSPFFVIAAGRPSVWGPEARATARRASQSASLRRAAVLHYASWRPEIAGWSGYASIRSCRSIPAST